MKHLKKFDTQEEKQTLLSEGIYVQPHVSWIAENDEVNYNNLDKTLVAPYGMHLTGDSHQYTVDSSGKITGVTGTTTPILLNGTLNLIRANYSGAQSELYFDNAKYRNEAITVYDLDLNEGWKYSDTGFLSSHYWTFPASKTLEFYQHYSPQWKRVLLGNDGKWYDLQHYTHVSGVYSYYGYILVGDGAFDGYCFEYGLNSSQHSYYAEFKKVPKDYSSSRYGDAIWCYIEEI